MRERIHIVGPGRLGLALGLALHDADALAELVYWGRGDEPPEHPLFNQRIADYRAGIGLPGAGTTLCFLTVPDRALREVAAAMASFGPGGDPCPVFHASGALGTDVLEPLHRAGWPIGTFHPLLPIGNPVTSAARLRGAWYAIGGVPEALRAARRLLHALGGHPLRIPSARRPLYHAAAATGSYHVQAVILSAVRLMTTIGVPEEDALPAVLSLARGALANLEELPAAHALTGPIVRGDVDTIRMHLQSLEPNEARLYRPLARAVLDVVPFTGSEEDRLALLSLLER